MKVRDNTLLLAHDSRPLFRAGVLATLVTLALTFGYGAPAQPQSSNQSQTECTGGFEQDPLTGTHENVIVPPETTCLISNATVRGNVTALKDSRLISHSNLILGNLEGDKAEVVQSFNDTVRQNILIKKGETHEAPSGTGIIDVAIQGTTVPEGTIQIKKMTGFILVGRDVCGGCGSGSPVNAGNLKVEHNIIPSNALLSIDHNSVRQNLQVSMNRGPGSKVVRNNTVGENLQCFKNTPPFVGGPNAAQNAEGQCTGGLAEAESPIDKSALAEGSGERAATLPEKTSATQEEATAP